MKPLIAFILVVFVGMLVYWQQKRFIIQSGDRKSLQCILYKDDFQVSDPFNNTYQKHSKWIKIAEFAPTPELQKQLLKLILHTNSSLSEPKFALEYSADHCLLFNLNDDSFQKFSFKKDGDDIILNHQEGFDLLYNGELKKILKVIILKNKL